MNENYYFFPYPCTASQCRFISAFFASLGAGVLILNVRQCSGIFKKVEIVGELGLTRALIISSISINLFFFVNRNLLRLNTNFSQGIICLH